MEKPKMNLANVGRVLCPGSVVSSTSLSLSVIFETAPCQRSNSRSDGPEEREKTQAKLNQITIHIEATTFSLQEGSATPLGP